MPEDIFLKFTESKVFSFAKWFGVAAFAVAAWSTRLQVNQIYSDKLIAKQAEIIQRHEVRIGSLEKSVIQSNSNLEGKINTLISIFGSMQEDIQELKREKHN